MATSEQTVFLITGANQGLGLEIVKKVASEQANYVILLGSRNAANGEKAAKSITNTAAGTSVVPITIDVTSDTSIDAAAKLVQEKYGRLDVLMNNAGVGHGKGSYRQQLLDVIGTNAVSAAVVVEAFIPLLKKATLPRILFMSSGLGSITSTLDPKFEFYGLENKPYLTSKATMNMLAAQYAVQLGKDGFKINAIDPGFRATNLNGYSAGAGNPADGATEAIRLIVDTDPKGQHGTFTSTEKQWPW